MAAQSNSAGRREPDLQSWPRISINDAQVSDVNARIGQRLRLRREMLELRQVDLAQLCEMSPQQIHKYENGDSKLSSVRLIQFAQVLDVRVGWFFGEDISEVTETNDFVDLLCDRTHLEVLLTLSQVSSTKRKEFIAQVVQTLSEDVQMQPESVDPTLGLDGAIEPFKP